MTQVFRFTRIGVKVFGCLLMLLNLLPVTAWAHGEIAQMSGIRMQTIHWYDLEISPRKVAVNDIVTVKGKFMVSNHWPAWLASVDGGWAFLNIGVPGPTFLRLDTRINGMPQIRSTSFQLGKIYDYEVVLKARVPGNWHVHPLINVWNAGPVVGPAKWVEITGSRADFKHEVKMLDGEIINPETYGLDTQVGMHLFWFAVGVLWIVYWFRKGPVMMRRYVAVQEWGEDEAESKLISVQDIVVSIGAVLFVVAATGAWVIYANNKYPVTIPIQTGRVDAPTQPVTAASQLVQATLERAVFNLPRRSLKLDISVTNFGEQPVQIGEYLAGSARFINPEVIKAEREEFYDIVAPNGIRLVDNKPIQAGETRKLTMYVEDTLWEDQRLTGIVYEADLRFAGVLFFFDKAGNRYHSEIGGNMIPEFMLGSNERN